MSCETSLVERRVGEQEMVNAAFEMSLGQGLRHERRLFTVLAATGDKAEGKKAHAEKREARRQGQ